MRGHAIANSVYIAAVNRVGKEDKLHSVVQVKEERIDEISKSTLASYKDKSTSSLKNAQANRDAAEHGKHMSKGFADLHKKSDEIAKKRVKGLKGYLQRKVGMKPVSEDNFADPNAATQFTSKYAAKARTRELADVPETRCFKELTS